MPDPLARPADRMQALAVVCVLAVASAIIATLGATPARVSATEALGAERAPGQAAFIASHRGGAATAPENTLPAVVEALRHGFDHVEVDVALTADGHAVLMHDERVDRTTDGRGALADLDLAHVRRLDAGSWFSPDYAGTGVPTFEEFLDVLGAEDGRAIVELKGRWDSAAVGGLIDAVVARGLERRVTVASFDATLLALVEARTSIVARLLILRHLPDDVVRAASDAGVRGIIADRRAVLERPGVVDALHDAGMRIVVYTLNSDDEWGEVTDLGVDGIVTDDPRTLSDWQRTLPEPGTPPADG
ncbi:glycerophosphodiester phosphodiesterase [Microbacterium aureliae]